MDEYRTLLLQSTHDVGLKNLCMPRPNIRRLLHLSAEPKHVWLLVQSVAILGAFVRYKGTAIVPYGKNHYFLHRWSKVWKVSKVELYGRLYGFEIQSKTLKTFSVFLWKATIKLKFLTWYPFSLCAMSDFCFNASDRSLCIGLFVPIFQLFTWNRNQWLAYSDLFSWTLSHASEHTNTTLSTNLSLDAKALTTLMRF